MKNSDYQLKIIVLAAGKSERFDGIKLLAKVEQQDDSFTLIEHVLQKMLDGLHKLTLNKSDLHVATGKYHAQIAEFIGKQFTLEHCDRAHCGLGHTIAQSVEKIISKEEYTSHIMITLADQIALSVDDYVMLIKQSVVTPNKLVCAKAGEEIMPPAIFPRAYFSELLNLTGDKGAKALLYANKANLQTVSLPNAVIDIDTKQELIDWRKNNALI